jgi:hypothetical protein
VIGVSQNKSNELDKTPESSTIFDRHSASDSISSETMIDRDAPKPPEAKAQSEIPDNVEYIKIPVPTHFFDPEKSPVNEKKREFMGTHEGTNACEATKPKPREKEKSFEFVGLTEMMNACERNK